MSENKQAGDAADVGDAGALFAFMGWLTTREAVSGPFSSHHEATSAVELVSAFCASQGWEVDDQKFPANLRAYPAP